MAQTTANGVAVGDDSGGESSWLSVIGQAIGVAGDVGKAAVTKNKPSANPDDYRTGTTEATQPDGTPVVTGNGMTYAIIAGAVVLALVLLIVLVKVL